MNIPDQLPCPKCGIMLPFTLREDIQHFGEIRCPVHGHRFIPKPKEEKRPKRKANSDLIYALPADRRHFCWACLRERELLKALKPSVSLQVHHIVEVSAGGTDDLKNLQLLCAECHAEVHRRREAFNRYRNKIAEAD